MNESGFLPKGEIVVVRPVKVEEKTAGGIVLPKISQDKEQLATQIGTLIAAGADAEVSANLEGIELGDVILYARYSGDKYPVDGVEYRILRARDVLGKVTKFPDYALGAAKSSLEVFGSNVPEKISA